MRQIIQNLRTGETSLQEIPVPMIRPGYILVKTTRSLVSLGTEKMLVEFSKANLINKARQQPDKVKLVLNKMQTEGVIPTLEAVFSKLDEPLPLGYCNVGIVEEVGKGITQYKVGDRVVSNGHHAEYVCVPENLLAKIPDNVSDEEASFAVIGSIALQGIRLCKPTFGETIVVMGLGLIGLITAELLRANGCNVIGFDLDDIKVNKAKEKKIQAFSIRNNDPIEVIKEITNLNMADGVIITASASTNQIIHQSALMCRKRGRIILVGVIGLNINRSDFYEKELTFQVSCSYGPGRYDELYEQKGQDYPFGFVRWTEQRNFEAILAALSGGQLIVKPLISELVNFADYNHVYSKISDNSKIASILVYPGRDQEKYREIQLHDKIFDRKEPVIGIIGSGNFTSNTIIPSLIKLKAQIKSIASINGLSASLQAKKAKIPVVTSDYTKIMNDDDVNTIIISTRHDLHAKMVLEGLKAGKNVFVEKPLCLSKEELDKILSEYNRADKILTVGFNRRFSPFSARIINLMAEGACNIVITVNAGFIPPDHWIHDLEKGGGRIIGEACHFIDLCAFYTGSRIVSISANAMGTNPTKVSDNVTIMVRHEDGSNAVINYFSNGNKSYPKEKVEIFQQGKILSLNNWRSLTGFGIKKSSNIKSRISKGHKEQFSALLDSISSGKSSIPIDEIVNTTRATIAATEALLRGKWVNID